MFLRIKTFVQYMSKWFANFFMNTSVWQLAHNVCMYTYCCVSTAFRHIIQTKLVIGIWHNKFEWHSRHEKSPLVWEESALMLWIIANKLEMHCFANHSRAYAQSNNKENYGAWLIRAVAWLCRTGVGLNMHTWNERTLNTKNSMSV